MLMKKQLLFFVTLLCALTGLRAEEYTLVKSVDEINSNDTYIIATLKNNNVYAVNAKEAAVEIVSGAGATLPESLQTSAAVRQFNVVDNGSYKALFCIGDQKYIGAGTSTTVNESATLSATNTSYQLTIADVSGKPGCVTIQSVAAAGGSTKRSLFFQNGTAFKNYAVSNYTNASYSYASLYRVKTGDPTDPRTPVKLEFEQAPNVLNVGETCQVSVISTPEVDGVTLSSEHPEVADISDAGIITAIAAGTTTIKASFKGNDTHKPADVSFELTVVKPLEGNVFMIEFKTGSNTGTALAKGAAPNTYITAETANVVASTGATSTAYATSTNGVRFASTKSAGSLTLVLAEDYQKKVTGMTINAAAYNTTDGSLTVNGVTQTISGTALKDYQYTFTPTDATKEISLSAPSGKRVYVKAITVYFQGEDGAYVDAPQFSPAAGEVKAGTMVSISCGTPDAVIYYTLDGTEPSASSTPYSTPIEIKETTTVKAIAVKDGMNDSPVNTGEFVVIPAYASLEAWLAAKPAADAIVEAPVTAVYQNGNRLYVADGGAFTLVYGNVGQTYANGDVIPGGIRGKYEEYMDLPQFVPAGDFAASTSKVDPVEPVTVGVLTADMINHYVVIDNVEIAEGQAGPAINATVGGEALALYSRFGINVTAGKNLSVVGFVGINNGNLQLYYTEIIEHPTQVAMPEVSPAFGTVYPGDVITVSCRMEDATLVGTFGETEIDQVAPFEYTVTDSDLDKTLTLSVKATLEGLDESEILTGEFNVVERPAAVSTDATFNWAEAESLNASGSMEFPSGKTQISVSDYTFTEGNVAVSFVKVNSNGIWYYGANSKEPNTLRLYANDKMVFTVNSALGSLKKIEFSFTANNESSFKLDEGQPGKILNGVWTAPEEALNVTSRADNDVKSVTFVSNGKIRMDKTSVTYVDVPTGIEQVEAVVDAAPVYYNLQGVRVAHPAEGGIYIRVRGTQVDKIRLWCPR